MCDQLQNGGYFDAFKEHLFFRANGGQNSERRMHCNSKARDFEKFAFIFSFKMQESQCLKHCKKKEKSCYIVFS